MAALVVAVIAASLAFAPDSASSMGGPSFSVTASGAAGTEVLEVKVNGSAEGTLLFGVASSTQSITLPTGTMWEDIVLEFDDAPGLDLVVSGFSLDGDQRSMISGDVLVSGQWTGTMCSSLGPPIGQTIHCNGVLQFPADGGDPDPPGPSPLDPSYWGNANTIVPIYDTAWDMGVQVTLEQGEEYMDFVANAGFAGFATTYLGAIHRPAARPDQMPVYTTPDGIGNAIATWDAATGNLIMDPDHADHFEDLLDAAHDRGLRVMLLVFWERKSVEEYGLINEGNAYNWAYQIGDRFKDHPAIQSWTLGGDAGQDDPRTQLWTNAVAGLRDAGATGDINFHTGSAPARRINQLNAEWNESQLVQTSHCAGTSLATSRLVGVMAQSSIPVWAGESRYEGIDATWCDPAVSIPTPQDIVDDALSFVNAGVAGVIYGHNERWQWGHGLEGSGGQGWTSVQQSFSAPGAYDLVAALGGTPPVIPDVVIDEFRYAPGDGRAEFIEIRNNDVETIDISGWQVDRFHTVPAGTMLAPGGRYVVASSLSEFSNEFPGAPVPEAQYQQDDALSDAGERIDLLTSSGALADSVDYEPDGAWPPLVSVQDGSLERVNGTDDGSDPASWTTSALGTPGTANGAVLCGGFAITVDLSLGQVATTGSDVILGTSGDDAVIAMAGDDVVCGLGGADEIYGGNGMDVILGGGGQDLLSGQGDNDVLLGGSGQDRVNGGNGVDLVVGGPGADLLRGQGGNDLIIGGADVDEIFGGSGSDEIYTGAGGNRATASVVSGGGNNDVIHGGPDNDHLLGISGIDELFGAGGNDLLSGGNGNDSLHGGAGDDQLAGGANRDLLFGGEGNDVLNAGTGNDDLFGESGDDVLNGQAGADNCDGGSAPGDTATGCETLVDIP